MRKVGIYLFLIVLFISLPAPVVIEGKRYRSEKAQARRDIKACRERCDIDHFRNGFGSGEKNRICKSYCN